MQKVTTKIVTKRNWNDHARTNPGPPTTEKQRPKQQPRKQRKRQPKQQLKKKTKRPRKNPTLVQTQNCNQDSGQTKDQGNKKYSNQSCKKKQESQWPRQPVLAATPFSWIKTIVLEPPNEVRKSVPKISFFFGCQLPGYVFRAVHPSVSCNNTTSTILRTLANKNVPISGQNNKTA